MKATRGREGFALMAALWLVVLVGVAGYELTTRSRTRRLAVANALEAVEARSAADAGMETLRASLDRQLREPVRSLSGISSASRLDPLGDLSFLGSDTLVLGNARSAAEAYDAGARIQLNRASEDDIRRFLVALPMDAREAERLAQRILDWRDPDTFARAHGAERADYLRLGARVLPADADFRDVAELRDVDGVTAEVYGRIASYFSVFGSGQINLNGAPRAVLLSLPGMSEEAADVLVSARQSRRPVRSLPELSARLTMADSRRALEEATADLMSQVTFEASEIVVRATGWVDGSPVHESTVTLLQRSGDVMTTVAKRPDR